VTSYPLLRLTSVSVPVTLDGVSFVVTTTFGDGEVADVEVEPSPDDLDTVQAVLDAAVAATMALREAAAADPHDVWCASQGALLTFVLDWREARLTDEPT
jgi:hypothetical protein